MRPDMFVTVEFPLSLPEMITVPTEAVLDSGLKKTLFVDRGNGWFEPRQVETGRRVGDRVEIVKGLTPGEKIVVSGNFLLDSETRLKNAAAGIFGTPGKDPVCGMALDEERAKAAGLTRQFGGKTWYFCGPEDMAKFDKAPQRYTGPNAVIEPMSMPPSGKLPMDHGAGGAMPMPAAQPGKGAGPKPAAMPMTMGSDTMKSLPGMKPSSGADKGTGAMPMKSPPGAAAPGSAPAADDAEKPPVDIADDELTSSGDSGDEHYPSLDPLKADPLKGAPPHDK
jgi:YHS domain-containing protein